MVYKHNSITTDTICTEHLQKEYQKYLAQVPWIYAISFIFEAFFGPVGGKLDIIIGPRYTCLIGSLLMGIGLFLTYFTCNNFTLFMITLGIVFGSGFGIGFTAVIVGAYSWWPHKKGLITGLVLSSIGFGVTIFSSIQTPFINPHNVHLNSDGCGYILNYDDVLENVPKCFMVLSIIFISVASIGIILLFPAHKYYDYIHGRENELKINHTIQQNLVDSNHTKPSTSLTRYDIPFLTLTPARLTNTQSICYKTSTQGTANSMISELSEDNDNGSTKRHQSMPASFTLPKKPKYYVSHASKLRLDTFYLELREKQIQYTVMESLKTIKFWQLFTIATLNYSVNVFFLSQWKVVSQNYFNIHDDYYLLLIGNLTGIFYGLGRVFWGLYFDLFDKSKYQFNIGMGRIVFFMTLFVGILPLIHTYINDNKHLVLICLSLLFFTTGTTYVTMPSTIAKTFGIHHAGVIFGALQYQQIPSSIIPVLLYYYFQDNFLTIFLILIGMGILSLLITIAFKTENIKDKQLNIKQKTQT